MVAAWLKAAIIGAAASTAVATLEAYLGLPMEPKNVLLALAPLFAGVIAFPVFVAGFALADLLRRR